MSGWKEQSLVELGQFSSGKPIVPGQVGRYPAFGSNGIIGGSDEFRYKAGLIIGRVGAYCGSVAVSRGQFWASDNTIVIEPVKDSDLDYLYYLLKSAKLNQHAGGAAQPLVTQGTLKALRFIVPEARSRNHIGAVLRCFDDLIENNRRRVELLEQMARAIYREWFVYFRYPGHEDVPLVDSAVGLIPQGWSVRTLDQVVTVSTSSIDPGIVDPSTPAVGLEHIPRGRLTLDDWGLAGEQGSRKATFRRGDILFGKIRPYFHKVSVAPVDGICSTDAIVIRPDARNWGQVVQVVSSVEFVAHATQTSNGTKMPRADWKVLGKWPTAVPPENLALSFTELTREQLSMAEVLMFQNRRLADLRDMLLPKLVTGQIDVSDLDLDALVSVGVVV